ncbi:hypothetical protein NA57DRAFT_37034 [Rhizodiscina lignyota]|uniref:Peroxisomal membrane protein PEX17 n=1 Tax=Rhizodiscina lignyota TaxID=1504668 RepID=A0A9P4MB80_9PEZI|nr:hypothetical protein NA57DRAFT_37034 [Rhizodiscina lignyota]
MPADRLLGTLLRSLQTYTDQQDTPRLLSTASSLLTTLTNPLNLTLLTSHLLAAPAIWDRPEGLGTCLRVMSVFHSAAATLVREGEIQEKDKPQPLYPDTPQIGGGMPREEWVKAVVKGADDRSQRWKHLMVLGGLFVGFEGQDREGLTRSMRRTLEDALARATNLAIVEARNGDELGAHCITLVLNHTFPLLSDADRAKLDYDGLLPVLVGTAYYSLEGFQSAYFLASIGMHIKTTEDQKFDWPSNSASARQIARVVSRPLVASMGPLSRLIAHAAEQVRDSLLVQTLVDDIAGFTRSLLTQWRQIGLSEVDASEEAQYFTADTLRTTLPPLWKLLRSTLFASVIILRAAIGRLLGDRLLSSDAVAPVMVSQSLHALRNLYFISSRTGTHSFTQYTFVCLTAIDILSTYAIHADAFLKSIRPVGLGQIPENALDRCLDLYFLNTAEHFTLVLTPTVNEELLVAAAAPYLAAGGSNDLLPIFEAAHSVILSVLSAPQSAELTAKHLPFYVDALFSVFPHNLSPRQFRLAFKTLMRVTAPPAPLSATQPDLPGALMELVHHRALSAPATPLNTPQPTTPMTQPDDSPPLSEQAVLVLTFLDALPFLPLDLLDESLPMSANLINRVSDVSMRKICQERLWEILISGEMDPERSQMCVTWWNTHGGRDAVFLGQGADENGPFMSGALPMQEGQSKL